MDSARAGGANAASASGVTSYVVLAGQVATAMDAAGFEVRGGRIQRLFAPRDALPAALPVRDFRPHLVAPGTIDVHTHGAVERSFSSGPPDDTVAICRYRATTGCSGLLATITGEWDELLAALEKLGRLTGPVEGGARLLGIHVEGPFLNVARKGAIGPATIRPVSLDELRRLQDAAGGAIRMMTVAPEMPGALAAIEEMVRLGIVPSVGHSDATYEQVRDAASAGARKATHTYNAMRPLHHRDPGTVGGVLDDERLYAEVIADGVHVHMGAIGVLVRAKTPARTLLVTDGVRYAGLGEGVYEREGRGRVTVRDGAAVLDDGTIAGSVSPMNRNLRLVRDALRPGYDDLFTMAASAPAAVLGLTASGALAPGADADFAVYDGDMACLATFIGGRQVYARP